MVPKTLSQFVDSSLIILESFKGLWTDLVLSYGLRCETHQPISPEDQSGAIDSAPRGYKALADAWGLLQATAQPFCHSFLTQELVPFYGDRCIYTGMGIVELIRFETALLRSPLRDPHLPRCVACRSYATVPALDESIIGTSPAEYPLLWMTVCRTKGNQSNRYCCDCKHMWLTPREMPVSAAQLSDPLVVLFGKFKPGLEQTVVEYANACMRFGLAPVGSPDQAAAHREKMRIFVSMSVEWKRLFESARGWVQRQQQG